MSAMMCMESLGGVAPRAHAAGIRRPILVVRLLVLVEAVEAPGARAHETPDGRALAGALATVGDRAAGRADRRADRRADGAVLHDLDRLVLGIALGTGLRRRIAVARP